MRLNDGVVREQELQRWRGVECWTSGDVLTPVEEWMSWRLEDVTIG